MFLKNKSILAWACILLLIHYSLTQNMINRLKQEINIIDLPEKFPVGTLVCNVRTLALAFAPDNKTRENKNLLRFQIKTPFGNGNGGKLSASDFAVNETSGDMVTKRWLDRDELCRGMPECIVTMDVQVTPIEYYQLIHLAIKLVDLNDHSPTFPSNSTSIFLSSTPRKGQTFVLPTAADPDEGENGTVLYSMTKMINESDALDEYFSLEIQPCDQNQSCPVLRLTTDLNSSSGLGRLPQTFLLMATDGGSPPLTGNTIIKLHFIQTSPEAWLAFEESSYYVKIPENREAGLALVRVRAIRLSRYPSITELLGVTYSIVNEDRCSHVFKVNNSSGVLTSITQLDFESFQSCSLSVTATLYLRTTTIIPLFMATVANEAMATSTTCRIEIDIINLNDHAPTIELLTADLWVKAGSQEGMPVARLLVRDLDDEAAGLNDTINCTMDSSSTHLFHLQASVHHQFQLLTSPYFALQKFPSNIFPISVFCSDSGGIITKLYFQLNIIRRPPRFGQGWLVLWLEITELKPGRLLLDDLNITSCDSEGLVFTLTPDDSRLQGVVVIDPTEKSLILNSSLEVESLGIGTFGFNVIAVDSMDSNLNDTMLFYIEVFRNEQTSSSPSSSSLSVKSIITFPYTVYPQNINRLTTISDDDDDDDNNNSNNNNNIDSDPTKPSLISNFMTSYSTNVDTKSNNTIIIIVGIACGTFIVIAIVIAVIVAMVMCNRRSARKRRTARAQPAVGNLNLPLSDDVACHPIGGRMEKTLRGSCSFRTEDNGARMTSYVGPSPAVKTRDEESLESEGADSGRGQSCGEDAHSSGSNITGEFLRKYYVCPPILPTSIQSHKSNHPESDPSPHLSLHPLPHLSLHPSIRNSFAIHPPSKPIHSSFPSSKKYRSRIKVGTGLQSIYNTPTPDHHKKVTRDFFNDQRDYIDSGSTSQRRGTIPRHLHQGSTTSPIYSELYNELREDIRINRNSSSSSLSDGNTNYCNYNHGRNIYANINKDSYV